MLSLKLDFENAVRLLMATDRPGFKATRGYYHLSAVLTSISQDRKLVAEPPQIENVV